MTRQEFDVWRDGHAATFHLVGPQDGAMLDAWFEHFRAAGYTADELVAATRLIALDPEPPRFRADHLAAINRHVRYGRQHRLRAVMPDPAEVGECVDCGNGGTVADMPHPRYVVAGRWDGTTCGVTCHCWAGRRIMDAWESLTAEQQRNRPAPTVHWDRYVQMVPNWRELRAWADELRAKARAARSAAAAADLAGPISQVIRAAGSVSAPQPVTATVHTEEETSDGDCPF